MTGAELAAVLTAAAGLVAAVTALVRAWRTSNALASHVAEHQAVATASARRWPADGSGAQ
jgi:hypothetical protein